MSMPTVQSLPEAERPKLGTLLASVGRKVKLSDEEMAVFSQRDSTPAKQVSFD